MFEYPVTPSQTAEQLGRRLREWRIVLGLSQELAAERAGVSIPVLSRIENGNPRVALGSVLAVVETLNLTERLVAAVDPWETDLGRARAHLLNRRRAKRR